MFEKSFYIITGLIFSFLFCNKGNGQDIHYSNNYENFYNLNPANITLIKNAAIGLNYRNQWPGSSDFVNYSAAVFKTFKDLKSTIGLQALRDDQGKGIITNTGFSLFYGYRTKISEEIVLAAGISGAYYIYKLNMDQLVFENNQLPVSFDNLNKHYIDFGAGLEFEIYKMNTIGFSVSHLSSPQINSINNLPYKLTLNYHGVYDLMNPYSFHKIYLEPLIVSSFQSNANELIYGSKISIQGIEGGLFLRNDENFNFDAIIILLGINFGNITLNYSYDINLSGSRSRFNKLASHEVTFFYNLEYNNRRNKKGAIKCPKI
jgi:type IX secretion system PorP/SprF family membrane protein